MNFLLVDENADRIELIRKFLQNDISNTELILIKDQKSLDSTLTNPNFDFVIYCGQPEWLDLTTFLKTIRQFSADIPILMIGDQCPAHIAVQAVTNGLSDYLPLPEIHRLGFVVKDCIKKSGMQRMQAKADHDLRESELRFRQLAENSQDVIFRMQYSPELSIDYISPSVESIIGYTPAEFYADINILRRILYKDDKYLLDKLIHSPQKLDQSRSIRWVAKNGNIIWAEHKLSFGFDDSGKLCSIDGIARDITDRKIAELRLQNSEIKFRSIFEKASDAIFLMDGERFIDCNPRTEEMFGCTRDQILQFHPYDFSPQLQPCGRLSSELVAEIIQDAQAGIPQYFEWTHCKLDGTHFEARVSLMNFELDGHQYLQAIVHDMAEQKQTERLLRESEVQYRLLFENNPNPMLIYSPKSLKILAVNSNAVKKYGYSREEFLDLTLRDIRPKKELSRFDNMIADRKRLFKNSDDWHHLAKDGTVFDVELHSNKIQWQGTSAVLVLVSDITRRKKAEQDIQHRLHFQETVSKISSLFVGLFDTNSAIQYALETVGKMTRASRAYLFMIRESGKVMDNTHEWCMRGVKPQIENLKNMPTNVFPWWMSKLRHGELIHITDVTSLPDEASIERETLAAQSIKSLIVFGIRSNGQLRGFMGLDNIRKGGQWQDDDITYLRIASEIIGNALERNQVEKALRSSEEQYRKFFEEDLTGDYIATIDGKLLSCNPAFVRMFGFKSMEQACFHNTDYLFHEKEDRKGFIELLRKKQKIYEMESTLRSIDGRDIHVIENAIGIFNSKGELEQIKGYLFDNTERKLLEDKLHQAQKMEAIGRLAGGIAHDFNNLLTVMQGYTDLILMDLKSDHPHNGKVSAIQKAIERATSLTSQLLAFSRKQIVQSKVLNLNEQIEEMTKILERVIGEDIELCTKLEPQLHSINADTGQLSQIIMNMAVNARDAMPGGGRLTIKTSNINIADVFPDKLVDGKPNDYTLLSIEDSGLGMDEETKSRIFEPFFTTKDEGKGTGLGLATVFGIVQQNNGFINVYSEPGRGTSFKIYWPACRGSKQNPLDVKLKEGYSVRGDETLLVVEDQEEVRTLVKDVLKKNGYEVIHTESAKKALELYQQMSEKISLVLTDIIMPQMNGRELVNELKLHNPDINVIYMSGYSGEFANFQDFIEADVNFIQKPFTATALLKKIREALDIKTEAIPDMGE